MNQNVALFLLVGGTVLLFVWYFRNKSKQEQQAQASRNFGSGPITVQQAETLARKAKESLANVDRIDDDGLRYHLHYAIHLRLRAKFPDNKTDYSREEIFDEIDSFVHDVRTGRITEV